jgi:hypothetical protein
MSQRLARNEEGVLLIDVRGPRFGAAITTVVLGTALVVQGPVGIGLVAWQWLAFAISTVFGLAWSPYGNVFRFVKRRFDLGPAPDVETEGPPRFAQACGLAVATVALVLFASARRPPAGSPSGWCWRCRRCWRSPGSASAASSTSSVSVPAAARAAPTATTSGAWPDGSDRPAPPPRPRPRRRRRPRRPLVAAPRRSRPRAEDGELITADHLDDLGLDLRGAEAGAVLLGSPHCSPCEQVKRVLGQLAGDRPTFRWVAVDAALHLGLAEAHRVLRVPTLFLVEPDGRILARTSGVPRVDDLRRVLDGEADLAHVRAA